jgi:hypothetical protein
MPESDLLPADVAAWTGGRLSGEDPVVATLLAATLADARAFCGWPVTPAREDTITLDGPGSPLLVLPTLRMTGLAEVTEYGLPVDVAALAWSARGLVRKKSGMWWSAQFGAITVKFTHGFTVAEAAGWRAAGVSCVDRRSLDLGGVGQPTKVGPFEWADVPGSLFSEAERAALEQFRLERPA